MDSESRRKAVIAQALKKTRGQKVVAAGRAPRYPVNAERSYARLANEYMKLERQLILEGLPDLKKIIADGDSGFNADSKKENEEQRGRTRMNRMARAAELLDQWFDDIERKLRGAMGLDKLKREINAIAAMTERLTKNEWKKTVRKTLGIDLLTDYYSGDFYKEIIPKWISENVELITSVPSESLSAMKEIVYRSYMSGKATTDIVKEIQHQYGADKKRARLLARDQIGKLNADISQKQQRDAGAKKYIWSDSGDSRVRECHQELNGQTFSWDDPPEMWYATKHGIVYTGRHCHPGQDYECRCVALPVFDLDELDLPT